MLPDAHGVRSCARKGAVFGRWPGTVSLMRTRCEQRVSSVLSESIFGSFPY